MAGIETATFGAIKHILIDPTSAITVGAIVDVSKILLPDEKGDYVLKAGTPVGHATEKLSGKRQEKLSEADGSETHALGIVLSDVYFDSGEKEVNATIVINGCIDTSKIDATTVEKITDAVKAELPAITFVNGRNKD